jgi:hypothetical protein
LNGIPLLPIVSLSGVQSRVPENYKLQDMKTKAVAGLITANNSTLTSYVNSILNLSYSDLMELYTNSDGSFKTLFNEALPKGFGNLREYMNMPGIYYFLGVSGKNYVGSSSNL